MSETIPDIPEVTERDLFVTRAFDAPRAVVWKFFTDPEFLAKWFGPAGVHVDPATVRVDLEVGGRWDLDMVDDATGQHYPVRSQLVVVRPPEYLEALLEPSGESGPPEELRLRLWFHDHGSKTRLTLHQGPFSPEFRDMTGAGWEDSFVKIDRLLASAAENH